MASTAKHGLVILDIAVIDADEMDAVHLKAVQTVDVVFAYKLLERTQIGFEGVVFYFFSCSSVFFLNRQEKKP